VLRRVDVKSRTWKAASKENASLKKASTIIIPILLSFVLLCMAFVLVLAQQETTIQTVNPASGAVGSQVNVQGTIDTVNGSYLVYFGNQLVANSTSEEYSVNCNFTVPNLAAGAYNITLVDTISNHTATKVFTIPAVSGFSVIPVSTFAIMGIGILIAFVNSGINRLLVSRLIGWQQYKSMQKEVNEWNAQRMAAMRANDKKQIEKLKKKESQMMTMQAKMAKPQLILVGVSFIYIVVWIFVLTPTFGATTVAYLPGFEGVLGAFGSHGSMGVLYWYPICSFLFGTLSSKILGIIPIE